MRSWESSFISRSLSSSRRYSSWLLGGSLSCAAPKLPVTTVIVIYGLIADAVFVGLPLAISVWQNARVNNALATA